MAVAITYFERLTYLILLTALVFTTKTAAVKQFNFYQKYFIEDVCASKQSLMYILDSDGLFSAAQISASRFPWYGSNRNCTVVIQPPPFRGVILTVESLSLGYSSAQYGCTDYIQVITSDDNSTKLCGHIVYGNGPSFISNQGILLIYHTTSADMSLRGTGFTVTVTSFSRGSAYCFDEQFRCKQGTCIWEKFACDGVNNCGDNSDEDLDGESQCREMPEFTAKPVDFNWDFIQPTGVVSTSQRKMATVTTGIFCVFVIMMTVVLRFICYRCNQRDDRALRRRLSALRNRNFWRRFSNMDRGPPPPYITLVNETTNIQTTSVAEAPPPYTVAIPEEEEEKKSPTETVVKSTVQEAGNDVSSERDSGKPDDPPPYSP